MEQEGETVNADELLSRLQDESVELGKMRHRIEDMADEYCDIDNLDLGLMRKELGRAADKMSIACDSILSGVIYLRNYIKDGGI